MENISVTLKPRHIRFLEREKRERGSNRSAVLRGILDARIKEDKVVVPLFKQEKQYLTELARDINVPLPTALHFIIYVYKRIEGALEELFQPRREAVEKVPTEGRN